MVAHCRYWTPKRRAKVPSSSRNTWEEPSEVFAEIFWPCVSGLHQRCQGWLVKIFFFFLLCLLFRNFTLKYFVSLNRLTKYFYVSLPNIKKCLSLGQVILIEIAFVLWMILAFLFLFWLMNEWMLWNCFGGQCTNEYTLHF